MRNGFTGKEGPVHDVQWSYSGSEFAVVYGCILFICTSYLSCLMLLMGRFSYQISQYGLSTGCLKLTGKLEKILSLFWTWG